MKKVITIEIDQDALAWAQRYTLDPALHAQQMVEHWAQLAQQENPGKKLEEVLTCKAKNDAAQQERDKQFLVQQSEQEKTEAAKLDAEKEQAAQQQKQAVEMQAQVEQRAKQMLAEVIAQLPKNTQSLLTKPSQVK